jgi:hypothetical protein
MKQPRSRELKITEFDAVHLTRLTDSEAAKGKNSRLLDVVMPNGKKLRDCTGAELAQIAEALTEIGRRNEQRAIWLRAQL